jgi:hypothetical protein
MGLRANNKGDGDFAIAPEGMHHAVCYGVVDIGTQRGEFNGKEKLQHKCVIIWEFANLKTDDDKPMVISGFYTVSLHEKSKLFKHLKSWRGKSFTTEELDDFDLTAIQGKNCMLQVIHNESKGKTYANIENIMPLMDNMEAIQSVNSPLVYELQPGFIPEDMYEWIANKIKASVEWNEEKSQAPEEKSDVETF